MASKASADGIIHELDVEEALHAVGLELLLLTEELIYATRSLNEEECAAVGDRVYLLVQVLGSILVAHKARLSHLRVVLPDSVGSIRIQNPYYEGKSETPADKAAGGSDGSVGEFPF